MTTKIPLLFAIIATLPFEVWADVHIGPIGNMMTNDNPVIATDFPYYATVDIDSHDDEHIASTAYVKGAYNDTIAAMNKLNAYTQPQMFVLDPDTGDEVPVGSLVSSSIDQGDFTDLITVVGVANAIDEVNDTIASKRVTIYTTWDDDSANATTQVELSTAQ